VSQPYVIIDSQMKVIVDNIATEYLDEGNGPVILMLHGWRDSLHTFDSLSSELGEKYRVVRLDMPGFGKTEMPQETWDVEKYVTFVSDFLVKIKVKPEVILGHSFGGRVAIRGIATDSFYPQKLILVGSAGISKRVTLRNVLVTVAAKLFGVVTLIPPLLFYRHQIRRKAYKVIGSDYLEAGLLRETYLRVISEDLQVFASKIKLPTQLIWGNNDTETPVEDGKKYASLISGSTLSVIPDAGHMVHQEQVVKVAKIVKDFV
jgi:pimeloyl-ACP methyl ester carboxylesterase